MDYVNLKEKSLVVTREPLAGATLSNLIILIAHNWYKIKIRYIPRTLFSLTLSTLLLPFRLIENQKFGKKIEKTQIKNDPIFIIGHWRSGTTFLHNILSLDENLGYLNTFSAFFPSLFLGFEKIFKPIIALNIPQKRPMDNIHMDVDLPQEDEYALAALTQFSIHHSFCFPQNSQLYDKFVTMENVQKKSVEEWKRIYLYIIKKTTLRNNGKQLVLKNPSNTARVKLLLEMFPNAKFIHIYRDPYQLYYSMMKFILISGPFFCLQKPPSPNELEKIILTMYKQIYKQYFKEKKYIPKGNLVEISNENFIQQPLQNLRKIYNELHLDNYKNSEKIFMEYISSQASVKTHKYKINKDIKERIYKEWKFAFNEFGYEK